MRSILLLKKNKIKKRKKKTEEEERRTMRKVFPSNNSLLFVIVVVAFFLIKFPHYGSSEEMYFAASEMKDVVDFERIIGTTFLQFYKRETERLNRIEKFLMDKERLHRRGHRVDVTEANTEDGRNQKQKRASAFMSHPTDSYKLMKRMVTEWNDLSSWMYTSQESRQELESLALNVKRIFAFQEGKELRGSFLSIFKLQDTYKISVAEMVNGLREPSHKLNYDDMFEIATYAIHYWVFPRAIEWASYIIQQFDDASNDVDVSVGRSMLSNVYDILSWANYKTRNYELASEASKIALKLNHTHVRQYNLAWYQQLHATQKHPGDTVGIPEDDPENNKTLQAIRCRREEKLEQTYADTLFCQYYTPHPQFYLKPLKLERLYHDPRIDVYHELLSNTEVNYIKEKARSRLNLAKVYSLETGKMTTASYRTSKTTWLLPHEDSVLLRILNRVGALGNFDMTYAEPFQVANYGIGGNYEAHYDFVTPPHNSSVFGAYDFGNRMATMLFYLETVEEGGDTTFINLLPGVSTAAVKGSGVFWHNLKKSGQGDMRTKHAACPVLLGEKWISNLWIHEHGQEFSHPCTTNPDD